MCDPEREKAANIVGSVMVVTVAKARKDPRTFSNPDAQSLDYFSGLGATLVNIPPKCDQAEKALTQEDLPEQAAEARHKEKRFSRER